MNGPSSPGLTATLLTQGPHLDSNYANVVLFHFISLQGIFLKKKLPSARLVWNFCLLNLDGVQRGESPHLSYPQLSVV